MKYTQNLKVAIILLLSLLGCNKEKDNNENVSTSSNLTFVKALYSVPLTFDPIKMNDTASLIFSNLVYDGLVRFSPFMELQPALAQSWETDSSGKKITFKLRDNIYFHNGEKINAVDVVKSLTRAVSKESTVYKYYDCIEGAEEYYSGKSKTVSGLQSLNDRTIVIKLKYPFPPFLSVLAGGTAKILPHDLITKNEFFKSPIGSGPYKFDSIIKVSEQTDLVFSRFIKYYSKVNIDKLVLRATDEKIAVEQAIDGKIHDLANYPLSGKEDVFKFGKKIDSPSAWTWIIGMNTRIVPFNDIETRISFRDSVDSEKFRKEFYPDAIPAYGYVPPGMPGYLDKPSSRAKIISAISKTKIKIAFPNVLAQEKEMRKSFEKDLIAKGWDVEFVPVSWEKLMEGYSNKTLQGFAVAMNIDYPNTEFLARNFDSTNSDNFSGLSNPKLDRLIHLARTINDRIKRDELHSQVIDLINASAVSVNLFHPRSHYWVNNCVKGFEPNLISDVYIDYTKVSVESDCGPRLEASR